MRNAAFPCLVLCIAGLVATASAGSPPPRGDRESYAAQWQALGLEPVARRSLDLLYLRPGAASRLHALQFAPVQVEMREDWQRANRSLERARLRPDETQRLKDEVAAIVADELNKEFAGASVATGAAAPVLQARVVDLYLNAPEMQSAVASRTYTESFGDMAFVAELREGAAGPLLLGSWDHRPARDFVAPRLTTRVDNAIEVRAAAHGWARLLHREFERLGGG